MTANELVTWPQVLAFRGTRQHLAALAPAAALLDVASRIIGAHAQVAASAELTLWARLDGLAPGAVDAALWEDRTLVKTWAMRGTLHLVPAAELGLLVGAQGGLKPRHHQAAWLRHHGLTREGAEAMLAAIPVALRGGELTREELAAAVAQATGAPELVEKLRGGFGDLLKPAAFAGDLVFAPSEGQKVRFTHPDRWIGPLAVPDPDAAAREVATRYLRAYGPATREAFARWFGMPSPAQAGRWLRGLGDVVVEVELDGRAHLLLAEDLPALEAAAPTGWVRLLPAFDHYVVAAPRDAEAVLPAPHRARVYRPQGWLSPVVVHDGVMVATWAHERAAITVEPFGRTLPAEVRRGIEAEAARLAAFLGGEPHVTIRR